MSYQSGHPASSYDRAPRPPPILPMFTDFCKGVPAEGYSPPSIGPSSSEGSTTPTTRRNLPPRVGAEAAGASTGDSKKREDGDKHKFSEKLRRRQAHYFFALLNDNIPSELFFEVQQHLKLEVLHSETHKVEIAKNASVTLAYIFINALKKLAVYYSHMVAHLRHQLDDANAQIASLSTGPRDARSTNVPPPSRTPLQSPPVPPIGSLSLQNPTDFADAHPADAIPDAEIKVLFEQLCLKDVILLGLAFGARTQNQLNADLSCIKTAAAESNRYYLPEDLQKAGSDKASGRKRRPTTGGAAQS